MVDSLAALGRAQTLWAPRASQIARSEMAKFIASVGGSVVDYRSFHAWSASDLAGFWGAIWDYGRVVGDRGSQVVRKHGNGDAGRTVFFPEASINIAENALSLSKDHIAIRFASRSGKMEELTIRELRNETARVVNGLDELGIGVGDVVASILPNGPERLIAYLACQAYGALWVQLPDGITGEEVRRLVVRLHVRLVFSNAADERCKGLFTETDVSSAMKRAGQFPPAVVLTGSEAKTDAIQPIHRWESFGRAGKALHFRRVAFNEPAALLLAGDLENLEIVSHSAGGILLTHLKEHLLHGDLKPGDIVLCNADCDPRLWLWQISALACGATLVFPEIDTDAQSRWRIAEECNATHLIADPADLEVMREDEFHPIERHECPNLRVLYIPGEIVDETLFDWIYERIAKDIVLCPLVGDERLMAHYFIGSPLHPVRRGEFPALALGMALYVLDQFGRPVIARVGELVCCEPFPTMPTLGSATAESLGLDTVVIGRLAQITCYGSAMLCPERRTTALTDQETIIEEGARQTGSHAVAHPVASTR